MTAELKQGLSESVDELNWMDDDTKLLAKRKVDKLYILFQLHIYILFLLLHTLKNSITQAHIVHKVNTIQIDYINHHCSMTLLI